MIGRARFFVAAAVSAFIATQPAGAQQIGDPVPNTFLCTFKPGPITATYAANMAVQATGGRLLHVYSALLNGFAIRASAQAIAQLLDKDLDLSSCTQAHYVGLPDGEAGATAMPSRGGPPGSGGGGGGGNGGSGSGETIPWDIQRVGGPGTPNGRLAWVVDTGVGPNTDLVINGGLSRSFLTGDTLGGNTVSYADFNGHGTHVAGTIAAIRGNGIGIAGVAAGATVVSVRVLDSLGVAPDTDVLAGLNYVATAGTAGDVVNLSLNADPNSTVLDQAVVNLAAIGFHVVMAAGNDNVDVDIRKVSPADQNGTGLYTVSASDKRDRKASFSNYGGSVDWAEPGVGIVSLVPNSTGTTSKDGTSMAAPHLSGILLTGNATVVSGGTVSGDRDGSPDPIGVLP